MVNKLEYLKKSISSGKVIKLKRWFISCFGIPVLKPNNDWETDSYIDYDIVTQPDGLYYIEPLTTDDNSGGNKRTSELTSRLTSATHMGEALRKRPRMF